MSHQAVRRLPQVFAFAFFAMLSTVSQAQQTPVRITDAKLHSLDYGIQSLMHWIQKARPGDRSRADALLRDHGKLVTRFGRIARSDSDQHQYVATRLKQARLAIEALSDTARESSSLPTTNADSGKTAATRSNPQLIGIASQIDQLQLDLTRYEGNHIQRRRMRSDLAKLRQRFDRLDASSSRDYIAVRDGLESVQSSLDPANGPLNMDVDQVRDYLSAIQRKYRKTITLPEARDILRTGELTAQDVDSILKKMKDFGENADADLPKLRQIVEATGQGEYWQRWLETESTERLKSNMASIKSAIDKRIETGLRNAKQRSELDPKTNRYSFSNEAMRKQHQADHVRTLRTIEQAVRLERALGSPVTWSPKRNEIRDYMATYAVKVRLASEVRELPDEVGTPDQHTAAKEVLAVQKYGVGKVVKQIVNAKPVPRERIEHKARSGSIETIVRKWKQFQVTTIEREDDKLFVYVNDIAKYSQAPHPTPIGQWILKQRFQRGQIDPSIAEIR
ncbi:MAG: hypothetical protein AAF989_11720 [Planctomycetota bacterium]